jgi:hypothetical protein
LFYFDGKALLTGKSEYDAKKMPQQVEMDIKLIDQFLRVVVHEKSGTEQLRGFIQAPLAFRNIYVMHLRADRGPRRLIFAHLLIYLSMISCSYALFIFF